MGVTERAGFHSREDDCKLNDGVSLHFGDGADSDDSTVGDVSLQWDGTDLTITGTGAIKLGAGVTLNPDQTGAQTVYQSRSTVAFTDTSAKSLFTIPANADVVGITVDVTTAFDGTGTDHLDLGITGTAEHFRSNLDVSSTGQTVTGWSNLGDVGSSDIDVEAIYVDQNSDAAAGAATVVIFWTVA